MNNYEKMVKLLKKKNYNFYNGRIFNEFEDNNVTYKIELHLKNSHSTIVDIYNTFNTDGKEYFNIILEYSTEIYRDYDKKELLAILDFLSNV